ncbi:hypothetical protein MSG28_015748 [Choristoneura fumiferana]|uniref:Uncharacterized protein n=1 Tax=Choristoneura fumiferana TaxID=7141 RepID=A0ACC0KBD7_CHOFU|nr:hypothetical protein MSG28_015748 [Choristoneura fumiferana]
MGRRARRHDSCLSIMGKRNNEFGDKGDTRVLYKKSISTIRTRSKTYSGHSQIFTKSGIQQLKKEISQTNTLSTQCGKEKRDLAVETNVCMLRNYVRKRIKYSHRGTSSKSKFSVLTNVKNTEDSSASGDSTQNPEAGAKVALKNIDVVSIIVDNFKDLLNKWICENILENINENFPKLDTVRDSLLHKLERNDTKEKNSHSTFVYRSKIGKNRPQCYNKPKEPKKCSSTMKSKEKVKFVGKLSRYTIPFRCKKVRLVSTLSIPRDFEKSSLNSEDTNDNALYRVRKINQNVYLSLLKPKELFAGSSTFDLLVMSSRSLTKRCATYKIDNSQKKNLSKKVAFECRMPDSQSKTKSKFAMKNISTGDTFQKQGCNTVPSLVKSIYGDTSPSYVFLMSDNYTMTEYSSTPEGTNGESESSECNTQSREDKHCEAHLKSDVLSEKDRSDPMITIDFISQSLEFPPLKIVTSNTPNNILRKKVYSKINRASRKRTYNKCKRIKNNTFNTANIKSRHFTYLYKRVNRINAESNEFLNHFQSILKHLSKHDGDKNMRLDVQVNVFPIIENAASNLEAKINIDETLTNSKTELTTNRRTLDTLIESIETEALSKNGSTNLESKGAPEIITLLDGAMSEAKYILVPESDSINNDKKNKELSKVSDCSTITAGLEISHEINELKSVIKGLAVTTEKLMSVHLQEKNFTTSKKPPVETTVLYNPTTSTIRSSDSSQTPIVSKESKNKSKGIQMSDEFIRNNVHADFKLKKEPKKSDKTELNVRLTAKSTTYRFIESESILKVTDMTSLGNNATGPNDVGLTCSFPKSKSLFEVTNEKENRKLMAFYCEGLFRKPCRVKTSNCSSSVPSSCRPCDTKCCASSAKTIIPPQSIRTIDLRCPRKCGPYGDDYPEEDERNLIDCEDVCDVCPKCRRSVGFYEGFLYCLIIWIPVIIILSVFYLSVIKKNLPKKTTTTTGGNNTLVHLKLSDLGF